MKKVPIRQQTFAFLNKDPLSSPSDMQKLKISMYMKDKNKSKKPTSHSHQQKGQKQPLTHIAKRTKVKERMHDARRSMPNIAQLKREKSLKEYE